MRSGPWGVLDSDTGPLSFLIPLRRPLCSVLNVLLLDLESSRRPRGRDVIRHRVEWAGWAKAWVCPFGCRTRVYRAL